MPAGYFKATKPVPGDVRHVTGVATGAAATKRGFEEGTGTTSFTVLPPRIRVMVVSFSDKD